MMELNVSFRNIRQQISMAIDNLESQNNLIRTIRRLHALCDAKQSLSQ